MLAAPPAPPPEVVVVVVVESLPLDVLGCAALPVPLVPEEDAQGLGKGVVLVVP